MFKVLSAKVSRNNGLEGNGELGVCHILISY